MFLVRHRCVFFPTLHFHPIPNPYPTWCSPHSPPIPPHGVHPIPHPYPHMVFTPFPTHTPHGVHPIPHPYPHMVFTPFPTHTPHLHCQATPTSMVSLPWCTVVRRRGSMVSRPGYPGGGLVELFSSTVCGAERDIAAMVCKETVTGTYPLPPPPTQTMTGTYPSHTDHDTQNIKMLLSLQLLIRSGYQPSPPLYS